VFQRFLRQHGVTRVDLDNPLQDISLDFRGTGLRASICYPYAYVTTSRFCLANGCEDPARTDDVSITGCAQECRRYAFKLDHSWPRGASAPLGTAMNRHRRYRNAK
jgi:hypothetical protein